MQPSYKASLSRSQGRVGWAMIFRHPLKRDKKGQQGLRVRRGLGTTDEAVAQKFVNQMNQILSDTQFWSPAAQKKAEELFDPIVINAFYEDLVPTVPDYMAMREQVIPLPSKDQGYAKVLLLGTTGAGKTTVVRQLIGTDPKTERFPSTSSAKTTISDIEIVLNQDDAYRSVVTFFDRNYITQHIQECVLAAVHASIEQDDINEIERKLLEHSEQRFRLSYLLGTRKLMTRQVTEDEYEEEDYEEIEEGQDIDLSDAEVSSEEREVLFRKLTSYLELIRTLAKSNYETLVEQLEFAYDEASEDDQTAFWELFENEVEESEEFYVITEKIFEDVESKFDILEEGELYRDDSGWPSYWTFSTEDRKQFISIVNRFSSNYAPNFGRLLTPLVEGIRVIGPFAPKWHTGEELRLVIMDREGLGHTPDSASSVSTKITKRYQAVDTVLLIDNAAQPVQAAPTALMQSIVSSGYHAKLMVCFTHFDEVKGDNLPNQRMRMDHVLNSFDNAAVAVGRQLGTRAEQILRDVKNNRIFFFSSVHRDINTERKTLTHAELNKLIKAIQDSITPPAPLEAVPIYDLSTLDMSIETATRAFHNYWRAVLKLRVDSTVRPAHWTRVKALTRRLGILGEDEYSTLTPVADLLKNLRDQIYILLQTTAQWETAEADNDKRQAALDQITQHTSTALYEYVQSRLHLEHVNDWQDAYYRSGRGSASIRAHNIQSIYSQAAPIPSETSTSDARSFLQDIRKLLIDSIRSGGGKTLEIKIPVESM